MSTLLDTMTKFRVQITDGDFTWTYCENGIAPSIERLNALRSRIKNEEVEYKVWAEVLIGDSWVKVPEKNPILIG